ncbi:MAG: right-handed parallel beta-helix repeat-containing protein, partial [Candidatus Latescibacteria bacterium]|nr:right-handed parallel beta-helix repeat-containing protein [Candidatus Latescibacterota bacterium]
MVISCIKLLFIILVLMTGRAFSAEYFVALTGNDDNEGSIDRPFRSVQKAITVLKPGETCYLRSGHYYEHIVAENLHGSKDAPITLRAYRGEKVTLNGSEEIVGAWEKYDGHIYKTTLVKDIWQLFVNDRAMTSARWPNANLHDGSAWDMKISWRHMTPESQFGQAIDGRPFQHMERKRNEKTYTPLPQGKNVELLAEAGLDVTGAVAIMNIGSWLTWAQRVENHQSGSNTFTYPTDFVGSGQPMARAAERFPGKDAFWAIKNVREEQAHYYLEGKLSLLDVPGEWFYEPASKTLYLWTPDGGNPGEHKVRGKTQTYAMDVKNSSYVVLQDIDFYGTTFRFTDCHHITVKNSEFLYPSQSKLMLGDFQRAEVTLMTSSVRGGDRLPEKSYSNVIENCEFKYINGPGFEIAGMNDRIENCLFAFIDNTCLGTGGGGSLNAGNSYGMIFRRNTVHTAGNSEGFRGGYQAVIELNHIYNMGLMQHDGAAVNVGLARQTGTVVRYNWVHDTNRGGIRFDAVGSRTNYGSKGIIHHNVVWNSDRIAVKGDDHRVFNNTAFDNRSYDIGVLDQAPMGGINAKTITRNNLAGVMSGKFWRDHPIPGISDHNQTGDVREVLRDPDHLDFRPKGEAKIIDAGVVIEGDKVPDIGAYEDGALWYWIPGRQLPEASTPVPPDGAKQVKVNAGLMWLDGYTAVAHDVYLGTDKEAVMNADHASELFRGTVQNNLFDPGKLNAG